MKKILIMALILFVGCVRVNAQFKITPSGVEDIDGKGYWLVEIEGRTAKELFDAAKTYVLLNFKNPDAVLSEVENKTITIHGVYPNAIFAKKVLGTNILASVDMNLTLQFKDNKLRVNTPIINSMRMGGFDSPSVYFSGGMGIDGDVNMYKKGGKPNAPKVIESLTVFINSKVLEIVNALKGTSENEDEW